MSKKDCETVQTEETEEIQQLMQHMIRIEFFCYNLGHDWENWWKLNEIWMLNGKNVSILISYF